MLSLRLMVSEGEEFSQNWDLSMSEKNLNSERLAKGHQIIQTIDERLYAFSRL